MVNATRLPSTRRSLKKPRLTMSRVKSGSRTTFSASSTAACSTPMIRWYRLSSAQNKEVQFADDCACGHAAVCGPREMTPPDPPPNRAAMLVLGYLWPLAVVPLLVARDDAEVQWHAKHGLVLMG